MNPSSSSHVFRASRRLRCPRRTLSTSPSSAPGGSSASDSASAAMAAMSARLRASSNTTRDLPQIKVQLSLCLDFLSFAWCRDSSIWLQSQKPFYFGVTAFCGTIWTLFTLYALNAEKASSSGQFNLSINLTPLAFTPPLSVVSSFGLTTLSGLNSHAHT
jgi:hypothetical protein